MSGWFLPTCPLCSHVLLTEKESTGGKTHLSGLKSQTFSKGLTNGKFSGFLYLDPHNSVAQNIKCEVNSVFYETYMQKNLYLYTASWTKLLPFDFSKDILLCIWFVSNYKAHIFEKGDFIKVWNLKHRIMLYDLIKSEVIGYSKVSYLIKE